MKKITEIVVYLNYYAAIWYLFASQALAEDSILVPHGEDLSEDLGIFNDLLKTGQSFLFYGLCPVSGGLMVYNGIKGYGKAREEEKENYLKRIYAGAAIGSLPPILSAIKGIIPQ